MTTLMTRGRKIVAALVAVAAIGAAVGPTEASAKGWKHHHYGYGAAAVGTGLLLGAIIASSPRRAYAADCWTEKRRVYDAYGYPYVRRVRVCD